MTTESIEPVRLFFSYDPEDQQLKKGLEKHLAPLKREGLIFGWSNRDIKPGEEWELERDRHLNEADIILLLISADFIDSDYCYKFDKTIAMKRHEGGRAHVIPIILRPCDWRYSPVGKLHPLPTDGKPVQSNHWHTPDDAFLNVAEGIRKVVNDILKERWLNKGITLRESEKYDEALAAIEKAIQLDPNYAQAYCEKGIIFRDRPVRFSKGDENDCEKALVAFEKAIQLVPNYAQAYCEKGALLSHMWSKELDGFRHNEALDVFEKSIQLCPNYPRAYYEKGLILYEMKRSKEALTAFEKAIQLNPGYASYYLEKGNVLYSLERYEEALNAYEQVIQLNFKEASVYLNKGAVLYKLKRLEEALVAYEQAIQLNPKNEGAYMGKGNVLYQLKQFGEALMTYEQVIQLNPNSGFAYRNKGRVYERLAEQAYNKIKQHLMCSNCGELNPLGSIYCGCGTPLG